MATQVNQVWNFCNETSSRSIRERSTWLSGFDLQKYTNGFSKCDGVLIGSKTIQQVCEEYVTRRKQFKKAKLRWRVSNPQSSRRSLGWIGDSWLAIKVPTACKPLILLNVSASGHAHASHLFTMPKNGLTAMDRDAEGIEFAINVLATQKRLFLLLQTHFIRGGKFAIPPISPFPF